ncbi:response regulator [Ekhidna sp.]|uniref:response regulator n=1 Tax=Ekhidna sp. TaxID=2608089 RepID=UPI003BAC5CAB
MMVNNDFCILLIDDDPSINYLNKLIIEKADIHANVCDRTQADEALSQLSEGIINPNLILLDINMPTMNGWQFLEKYHELPEESRKSKVIILSSSINPSDKEKASQSSVILDFYSKPLSIANVKEIRETLLNEN